MFKRKAYEELLKWKKEWDGKYACLLEGARRVGKTTIAEEFARNEYESYILIDFSNVSKELLDVFDDISKIDRFFLRLQMYTGVELIERKSVIIFDEIQLFPKARQAIKHLVKDGRYDYIETGSLISIKKNVKDILIPSEEHKIHVYPMDYEEFMWATGANPNVLSMAYKSNIELGNAVNRNAMKDFRVYMSVGGMPQAVERYIATNNFEAVDKVKREILELYYDDLKKIDDSGRITDMYKSVPSQLASKKKEVDALNREIERIVAAAMKASSGNSGSNKTVVDTKLDEQFSKNKGKLPWPADGPVVDRFGKHYHPVYKNLQLPPNNGFDLALAKDTKVRAVFDGVVKQVMVMPGYNQCVMVQHGNYFTLYCKLKSIAVKEGDKVKTSDILGTIDTINGQTQLHFELWKGSKPQDPEQWLK